MTDPVTTSQLHREARLHIAAALYFLSRLAAVAFAFTVPVLYFLHGDIELPFVWGGALLVVSMVVAYYTAAGGLQCPACAAPVLIDNGTRKHVYARRLPGLNRRARVAWDI